MIASTKFKYKEYPHSTLHLLHIILLKSNISGRNALKGGITHFQHSAPSLIYLRVVWEIRKMFPPSVLPRTVALIVGDVISDMHHEDVLFFNADSEGIHFS